MTFNERPPGRNSTGYVTRRILEEHLQTLHEDLKGHFAEVIREIRHLLRAESGDTNEIKKELARIMALTANEQAQIDRINTAVEAIATEVKGTSQKILDLMAQHGVDQATIDGMEAEVVAALTPVADRAEEVANDLKDPATPLSPTP